MLGQMYFDDRDIWKQCEYVFFFIRNNLKRSVRNEYFIILFLTNLEMIVKFKHIESICKLTEVYFCWCLRK